MSDRLLTLVFLAAALILLFRFPRQLVRSVRRWGRDEPSPAVRRNGPDFEMLAARMRELARPSLLLVDATTPVFSKLGGDPQLRAGSPWPTGERRPLSFLAQIDLAEVQGAAPTEWLPQHGRLFVFFDQDRRGGADVVVVRLEAAASAEPPPAPKGLWRRFRERRVGFRLCRSVPSLDWLGLDASGLALSDGEFEALGKLGDTPPRDEIQHRIDGFPDEIQPQRMAISCEYEFQGLDEPRFGTPVSPEVEAAAEDWRLLLQIDSDEKLGMNWGDGGRLYIFVRAQDARAGNFSRTVTLEQFY